MKIIKALSNKNESACNIQNNIAIMIDGQHDIYGNKLTGDRDVYKVVQLLRSILTKTIAIIPDKRLVDIYRTALNLTRYSFARYFNVHIPEAELPLFSVALIRLSPNKKDDSLEYLIIGDESIIIERQNKSIIRDPDAKNISIKLKQERIKVNTGVGYYIGSLSGKSINNMHYGTTNIARGDKVAIVTKDYLQLKQNKKFMLLQIEI